jgi:hypothetical protein
MRALHAVGAMTAAFLLACAVPAPGHADGPPNPAGAVAQPTASGCDCPRVQHRHAWRPYRHARYYARHWRRGWPAPIALGAPIDYDPPIPSPWDSAYDRAMVLHLRSPEVSGTYVGEPGLPHTPPVRGIQHYRVQAGGAVLQYDELTGQYIRLAQSDAQRAFPSAPAPAPR